MTIVVLIVAIALLVLLYGWYAAIVRRRNQAEDALAGIDVQLTLRHDLIPNMLAVAKRFMAHERDLIEEITRLRAQGVQAVGARHAAAVSTKFATEARLGADLQRLFAVAENYPELKSQGSILEAQQALSEAETNIAAARRFYNSAVTQLRNATQIFPGTILAGMAGVTKLPPFYEAVREQRGAIDAAAYL